MTNEAKLNLRISHDLRSRLIREAEKNFRSLNAEIEYRLWESLKKEESK